jgi:lysophospholipid acyltransferase (LPLAT)-like uncharacterized protein
LKQWFRRPGVQAALAWLMAAYLRFALSTIRWRQENRACAEAVWDAPQPGRGGVVVCFWHSRIALSPACWPLERAQAPRALISLSPDGQFIAGAVQRLGFPAIRGSSRKPTDPGADKGGASAFRDVLKWIRGGGGVAITPDGPRGPAETMKDGAPMLGRVSGAPVLFVGLASRPCLRLNSWDKALIPLPFTRGAIVWAGGEPAARGADSADLAQAWAETLSAVTRQAEALVR